MVAWRCRFAVLVLAVALCAAVARGEAECCSTCIGKTSDNVYDYDPILYEQCGLPPIGSRICCFECGTWGEPEYGDSIAYGEDGTTPQVKAGTWVAIKWKSAAKLTYISLKQGQKKVTTPTIGDAAAAVESGYYMICAKAMGTLVLRGWGEDSCRQASPEKTIQIIEGDAGATCDAASPVAPSAVSTATSSGSGDDDIASCNLSRATVKTIDGKKQCVCVSDWAGAPACDQMPAWKWLITIGGGLAALFSIVISVRAFLQSREKKKQKQLQEEYDMELATPHLTAAKEDVEILRIGADRASPAPPQSHYRRPDEIYKIHDRECSL